MAQNFNWAKLLKVLIAVLTAIAGSIGVVSCMSWTRYDEFGNHSPSSERRWPCAARTCINVSISHREGSWCRALCEILRCAQDDTYAVSKGLGKYSYYNQSSSYNEFGSFHPLNTQCITILTSKLWAVYGWFWGGKRLCLPTRSRTDKKYVREKTITTWTEATYNPTQLQSPATSMCQ